MSRCPPDYPGAEAPPDPELLADAAELLERQLEAGAYAGAAAFALEEVLHLLEGMAPVATRRRQRLALRRVAELLASREYASVRAAAPRVGREVGAAAETVRGWWAAAGGWSPPGSIPPPAR